MMIGFPKSIANNGVMRLYKKGKFNPRYVGRYKISKGVGKEAYELDLPTRTSNTACDFSHFVIEEVFGLSSMYCAFRKYDFEVYSHLSRGTS